ncbi:MAG: phosphate acyltransferase PlsX [Lautropia sp.]
MGAHPRIAVDAMGGDFGLPVTVPASIDFLAAHPNASIVLVGRPDEIGAALDAERGGAFSKRRAGRRDGAGAGVDLASILARLTVVAASEVIASDDPPAQAMRSKRDSSMRVAIELVRKGEADACVSSGNTGALMAISRLVLRMLDGIDRPAIAAQLPNRLGSATTMLDLGANVDCSAANLQQFALMGSALVTVLDGKPRPLVGLLNIGEELIKGNDVVKEAAELIGASALNFHGNVEGNDIYAGTVDVIVSDGFVGNVALKTSEGVAQMLAGFLRDEFTRGPLAKLSALLARTVLQRFKDRADHRRYSGAILLGLKGIVFKSHGSSDAFAFEHALRRAHDAAKNDLIGRITTALAGAAPAAAQGAAVVDLVVGGAGGAGGSVAVPDADAKQPGRRAMAP